MRYKTKLETHVAKVLTKRKETKPLMFFNALVSVIDRGIKDENLKDTIYEILLKETSIEFFVMTTSKSGPITNKFLSTQKGSEIYHVLDMCLRVNRQLQMEPLLNIEIKEGIKLVDRKFFEQALTAIVLHDIRKCGGPNNFDSTKSDIYHGKIASELFIRYAKQNGINTKTIKHIETAIKYHDGRFSPLLREKYYNTNLSLYEILYKESKSKIGSILATTIHSLDMLTSNGLVPSPSNKEVESKMNYIQKTTDFLKCAFD